MSMIAVALVLALVATACAGDDDGEGGSGGPAAGGATTPTAPAATGTATPTTALRAPGDPAAARTRLTKVADVASPVAMAVRPNDDGIYVAEKTGRVRYIPKGQTTNPGAPEGAAVLDISGQVSTGSEQGLLGITFSPDGSKLYINYTDRAGDTQVVEYQFREGRADTGTRRLLLTVDQPFANHNGGEVVFGPDGKLYIGLGDGGSGGDPGNRAQNLAEHLGKLLRIDPAPSGDRPYTVPPDNPFVGRQGAAPEVWMYGLRNPWRFTWDRVTKDLWVADVGQNAWEEITFLPAGSPAGANLGWPLLEGTHRYKGANPDGAILPIFEYDHGDGSCSVTGGYVYRGSRVPALNGIYIYGDACTGNLWGLVQQGGRVTGQAELNVTGDDGPAGGRYTISSFGEDAAGEVYVLNLGGGVFRFDPA